MCTATWLPAGKRIGEEDMELLILQQEKIYLQAFIELRDVGVSEAALEKFADADAFRSIGLDRREALWEVSAMS